MFAEGDKAREAEEAGADVVGSADLAKRVEEGFTDFDVAIATPDQMGNVGRLGRCSARRGLMPNPKTGTVTMDVAKAVGRRRPESSSTGPTAARTSTSRSGRRASTSAQLVENYAAVIDEIIRAKPSAAKGRYIRKITLATTMGPGIQVDPDAHARHRRGARSGVNS